MVIQLTPQLQATLADEASKLGVTPEQLAITALQERFPPKLPPLVPRDDWERQLLAIGRNFGFSPPREWMTSENYYDQ